MKITNPMRMVSRYFPLRSSAFFAPLRLIVFGFNAAIAMFALAAGCGDSHAATAQWKPDKPIEIIVGTGVGGGQDKSARTVQKILQERRLVDVPVTVVNKPGGGGAVGWTYLNQHAGEGNIIYVGNPTLLTNHIAMALLAKAAGGDAKKLKTVVFQGGGEAMTALLGGHIDVNSSAANNVVPHQEAGKLRVLGVAAPRRLGGVLADVPTWKEQGVNALVTNWRMVAGPKGMTAAQILYWDGVLGKLTQTGEWKKDLELNAFENTYHNSAATGRYMNAEYAQFRAALSEVGMAK